MKSLLGYSGIIGMALGVVAAVAGFNLAFIAAHGIVVVIAYLVVLVTIVLRVPTYKVVMFLVMFTGSAGATSLYLLTNVHR